MNGMDETLRMKELVSRLQKAAQAYYSSDTEIMTNLEYDQLYDELKALEDKTGVILADSPTQHVGYQVMSALPKIRHARPMKSLDKTKDIGALAAFLKDSRGLLSWKLDGLTCVLTYQDGSLVQAATRGNGEIGEVITNNARFFHGVPLRIPYTGHLVVRGEALISYKDFERINNQLDPSQQYKNPRNLCSGSVRQLDPRIAKERNVTVIVYTLVESEQEDGFFHDSKKEQLTWLAGLGFETVAYKEVTQATVAEAEKQFTDVVGKMPFPVDGLVLTLDSLSESAALGSTAKFPRDSLAFKWQDEQAKTTLIQIEWSPSRTGLINPVAVFDPVELEGTTVRRASLHNVSYLREMKMGVGDQILVYKANMIIPQISENLTKTGPDPVPDVCPRCGGQTQVVTRDDVQELVCLNPSCPAKLLKALEHFASRQAMNIDGFSEATAARMADAGWLESLGDLYRLKDHKEQIEKMEGFGEKSCAKLLSSIERSRHTQLFRFLNGIGIPGIGTAGARLLADAFDQDLDSLMQADTERLSAIEGIGPVLADGIFRFFRQPDNQAMIRDLLNFIEIEKPESAAKELPLKGLTFVITGSLTHFENRDQLQSALIERGAKAASSISKNTSYLINNDIESTSTKNKKARQLGIPIISEEEAMKLMGMQVNDR